MASLPRPEELETWWSTTLDPWWRDFDYLGHVTAASYAAIYEEAFGRFAVENWKTPDPSYVVARMEIDYLREIRRFDTPIRVHVGIERIGTSSIHARLVLCGPDQSIRSSTLNRYVAWDSQERGPRELSGNEARSLEAFVRDGPKA